jgi:lipopolysaccharide transport system ATP-binding protein
VPQGESIGIIGRNGAGKSTLLKLLARITAPTEGTARIHGRLGTLLEVGTGFHPELSGRDNVFLSGSILGLSAQEVKAKFDEIVEFSGVEKFIDTPVKRYSSGMQVRLAFSVALHLNAEILIVDEVLAVGDIDFQRKSIRKLHETVTKDGRTVLFVSHSLGAVKNFCSSVIVLNEGQLAFAGPTDEGLEYYRNSVHLKQESLRDINLKDRQRRTNGSVRCTGVHVGGTSGVERWSFREGETIKARIEYEVIQPIPSLAFLFRLIAPSEDLSQRTELLVADLREAISSAPISPGYRGVINITIPATKLRSFAATPYIWFGNIENNVAYDVVDANVDLPALYVRPSGDASRGLVSLDYRFRATELAS